MNHEIYKLTSRHIFNSLKDKIKGGVYVKVEDDTLIVKVKTDCGLFMYTYEDWTLYVIMNGDLEYIISDVVYKIKKEILKKCFY